MATHSFRLKPGVNRVRVGSIVVDGKGYSTKDELEARLLDAQSDLTRGRATKPKTAAKPTAAAAEPADGEQG